MKSKIIIICAIFSIPQAVAGNKSPSMLFQSIYGKKPQASTASLSDLMHTAYPDYKQSNLQRERRTIDGEAKARCQAVTFRSKPFTWHKTASVLGCGLGAICIAGYLAIKPTSQTRNVPDAANSIMNATANGINLFNGSSIRTIGGGALIISGFLILKRLLTADVRAEKEKLEYKMELSRQELKEAREFYGKAAELLDQSSEDIKELQTSHAELQEKIHALHPLVQKLLTQIENLKVQDHERLHDLRKEIVQAQACQKAYKQQAQQFLDKLRALHPDKKEFAQAAQVFPQSKTGCLPWRKKIIPTIGLTTRENTIQAKQYKLAEQKSITNDARQDERFLESIENLLSDSQDSAEPAHSSNDILTHILTESQKE